MTVKKKREVRQDVGAADWQSLVEVDEIRELRPIVRQILLNHLREVTRLLIALEDDENVGDLPLEEVEFVLDDVESLGSNLQTDVEEVKEKLYHSEEETG